MVQYSNSSLGGALKSPGKNRLFALTFACNGKGAIAPSMIMEIGPMVGRKKGGKGGGGGGGAPAPAPAPASG